MAQLYRAFFDDLPGRSFETDGIAVYGTNLMHILLDKPRLDMAAQVLFDKGRPDMVGRQDMVEHPVMIGCQDMVERPDMIARQDMIGRPSSYRRSFLGCFANNLAHLSMDA